MMNDAEKLTFGSIHLIVRNIQKSSWFWENVIGLRLRKITESKAELGTENETLVIIETGASSSYSNGFSGLYHVAIHVPTEEEFAVILARMLEMKLPISPTDHIMSQAIYLLDPDGITIEITLETPDRFSRYDMDSGRFQVIDAEGRVRGATEILEVRPILEKFSDLDLNRKVSNESKVGHVHLYVPDLQESYDFYLDLGFEKNLISVPIGFADLSAGGEFKHRMAMNTWQSKGAPQAPEGTAGMKYFTVKYRDEQQLIKVVDNLSEVEENTGGFQVKDPGRNLLHLIV